MGNCCHPFGLKTASKNQKNIVLLLVGLDNAGKTTTAKHLIGEPLDTVVPTVGFSSVSLTHRGYCVVIYDLGGGPQIRGIWHRYYVDVHGIIFVVDASDISRLEESRSVLENLLANEKLAGKPVLLLANKQDCEGALDEVDIVEQLNVEAVVNQYRCPTLVEMCSATAVKNYHRKQDLAIHNGFRWLMNCIIRDYNNLNSRVEKDVAVQRKQEEQEKKERLERIRKAREERDEDVADGITGNRICSGEVDDGGDSDVVEANPFKPLADIMEDIKRPSAPTAPVVEPILDSRVILVKQSPQKIEPTNEDKQNQLDGSESNKLSRDLKRFVDIDGDEVELIASAGSRESLRSGAGGKNFLVTAVKSSPNHSATELIRGQLELEMSQHKKHGLLRRTNRVVPAPLSPANDRDQRSLDETDLCRVRNHNEKQGKSRPLFLRKQAFTEEISRPRESQVSPKKKQPIDISNLFCLRTRSASLEKLENSYAHESLHETNSADARNKKRLHTGELKLTNTKLEPMNTETSLPSDYIGADIQPSVESDKVTGIKWVSSNSFGSQSHDGLQGLDSEILPVSIRQWVIDTDGDTRCNQLSGAEKSLPEEEACVEHNSKVNSRQSSAHEGDVRLKQQASVDGTSSSGTTSQMGSQHLSDSGFVSPKNVLPPLRLTGTVDKPPWILPPLSSQTKPSSQDSLLDLNKPQVDATVTESQLSHDSNGEPLK